MKSKTVYNLFLFGAAFAMNLLQGEIANAEKMEDQSLLNLSLGAGGEIIFSVPPPVSTDAASGRSFAREYSVSRSGTSAWIQAEAAKAVNAPGASPRSAKIKMEVSWLKDVRGEEELMRFMAAQKAGGLPRYKGDDLRARLQQIKETHKAGAVYDLARGDFDPREPDSPDIFLISTDPPGTIWLKNASHLGFRWHEASVQLAPQAIGTVRMNSDESLDLMLRAQGPKGARGDFFRKIKKGEADYEKTLRHVGGLKVGETRPVPPWPNPGQGERGD